MRLPRYKQRGLALLLALALLLLAGCGTAPASARQMEAPQRETVEKKPGSDEEPEAELIREDAEAEPEEPEEEQAEDARGELGPIAVEGLLVGVCVYSMEDSFMDAYAHGLMDVLGEHGAEVWLFDADSDAATQLDQFLTLLTMGMDVLVVNLVQPTMAPALADYCHEAGIPVVFINRQPEEEEIRRWQDQGMAATYVGVDAAQAGLFQGELLLELLERDGVDGGDPLRYAMIMGDPESPEAQLRTEYAIRPLLDVGRDPACVFQQSAYWSREQSQELTATLLNVYGPAMDVVFCNNDAMALGAMEAIEGSGYRVGQDLYLLGIDATEEALLAILEGRMSGTVFNDPFAQARTVAQLVSAYVRGDMLENRYTVDYAKVTAENAGAVYDRYMLGRR